MLEEKMAETLVPQRFPADGKVLKRLDGMQPDEASAARVLRELVKNQRLG